MASHVSQCMAKACMCDTWQAMCVTHGMPCVNMHGSLPCLYKGLTWAVGRGKGELKISPWEQQGEEEGREGEGGEKEKRNGGKERRKGGKERRKRKECCAVSRPGRQRTRNCATRGRLHPTLVILRLGAV